MSSPATVAVIARDAEHRHLRCLVCGEQWAADRTATTLDVCPQLTRHGTRAAGPRPARRIRPPLDPTGGR
jgi:hypothetical protein